MPHAARLSQVGVQTQPYNPPRNQSGGSLAELHKIIPTGKVPFLTGRHHIEGYRVKDQLPQGTFPILGRVPLVSEICIEVRDAIDQKPSCAPVVHDCGLQPIFAQHEQ